MAAKDYYEVLGIKKTADAAEIKAAFRQLAKKYHPDVNGGEDSRFKEINEAYDTLSNPDRRARYDKWGQVTVVLPTKEHRYAIRKLAVTGDLADVYRAQNELGEDVALKIVRHPKNNDFLENEWKVLQRIGVMRTFSTRHGEGPFVTESAENLAPISEHNTHGEWQGRFRTGLLDLALTAYAIRALAGVDELAVTHMDCVRDLNTVCVGYNAGSGITLSETPLKRNVIYRDTDPAYQEALALTRVMNRAIKPVTVEVKAERFLSFIEDTLDTKVRTLSFGPRRKDKQLR